MSKDIPDWRDDVEKIKRIRRKADSGSRSVSVIMEYTFWTIAILFLIGMVASMPWVGPDKAIPGIVWLTASLGGMGVFGGLALTVRRLPEV